ncbi:prepilin-type N-terminal cleavage/methylation domain-containing protein [bacterium]|nr:prepilin-type N-terminal cleavage/methylation domain-containing protein [bacterium]
MLIINKKLSRKGFTLIELMVAVAILAVAVLGIFHAYSVGFMGIADARDRTVATNYVREAMEDIKNMDFDKIVIQERSDIYIDGTKTKFEREVIVQPSTNLKKVTANIYWKDRNGVTKTVGADMLIHFVQTTAGVETGVTLIADPYNILTEGASVLTAVVKDSRGNIISDYSDDISFTIISGIGNLFPSTVTPDQGRATTTFTASTIEGDVIIEASSRDLASDTVTIGVTDPNEPVKINLTAEPIFMTPGSSSLITAEIVNAGGVIVADAVDDITFSISGPGYLSDQTDLINGVVEITLTSNTTPATITITASATGLEPGVVNVITGGKIYLSASPISVPVNEISEITVTTQDLNGVLINYVGTINLNRDGSSTGSGSLPSSVDFDGSTSSLTATFTAIFEGDVIIVAEDQAGILTPADPITLNIIPTLIPDHIEVNAAPSSIEAGGYGTSTITAGIKTEEGIAIDSYTELIIFTTNEGTFPNGKKEINTNDIVNVIYNDGVATVQLYSSETASTATVTACSPSILECSITGSTEVGFYTEADRIELVSEPQNIVAGGATCTITATIKDGETTVTGYSEEVTFSIESGQESGKFDVTGRAIVTAVEGVAEINLSSKNNAGTVTIKAVTSFTDQYGNLKEIEGYLNIPVGIDIDLDLDFDISYNPSNYSVTFNIDVLGAELLLEEMKASWLPDNPDTENLGKIEITPSGAADSIIVYATNDDFPGSPASSEELINVNDITLSIGISTIILYFSENMSVKEKLDITFNPNSGKYIIELVEGP